MNTNIHESLRALLRNFINPYNGEYLIEIYGILRKNNINQLTIDIINNKMSVNDAFTDKIKNIISYSRDCFIKEIKRKNIDLKIILIFKSENEFSLEAVCIIDNDIYNEKIKILLKK